MKTSILPRSDNWCQERLKRAVIYSIAVGPRFFKWKMLSLSGPNALLFLQLWIALVTMSAVNVSAMLLLLSTHSHDP